MAKKVKRKVKRHIMKAKIDFISLCPAGANDICTMFKSDDGGMEEVHLTSLVSKMTEQGELLNVVYAPDMVDSQGDMASAAVIKDFAYDFAQNGAGIDIRHNEVPLSSNDIFVAESMIIQKNDPRFADFKDYDGNSVDVTGGWGTVLKINSEELREKYRSGEWGGVSMGGMMLYKKAAEKDENIVMKFFKELLNGQYNPNTNTNSTESPMNEADKKEMKDIAKEAVTEAIKATKEAEKVEAAKIAKEKGDKKGLGYEVPTCPAGADVAALFKHRQKLAIVKLSKSVDGSDASAVFEFEQSVKQIVTAKDDAELSKVVQKEAGSSLESFFTTNQDTADVSKAAIGDTDPIADAILAKMDKEDEAA